MTAEALLAYAHLMGILSLAVFITSETALCREGWINPAVITRLVRVDRIYWAALLATAATGLARTVWGIKGGGWYIGQPLWLGKLALWSLMALASIRPTLRFLRWARQLAADGSLPPHHEVVGTRRWILFEAHLMVLVPLLGALLARGVAVV